MTALEMTMQTNLAATGHLGEQLHALLDRELSPREESAARAHLGACASCAAAHAKLAAAVALLEDMGRARAPTGFAARVLKRMRAQRHGASLRVLSDHKLQFEGVIIVILAAAAAAALFAYEARISGGTVAKNEAAQTAPR